MKKSVFFDRDGIVNESPGKGYVECVADFHVMTNFPNVLRIVKDKGYEAVIVSNQRGVARGIVGIEEIEKMHRKLKSILSDKHNLELLDIFYCPHNEGECECRKPKPGMLLDAARKHDINLSGSWMIGDNERDIEAGRRAKCKTILVSADEFETQADFRVRDMKELKELVAEVL
ncbi:D-glycero-alpha-D-manno-heptose-1,7-bisphosphate 7-phosphatase [Verrucomicrobiota bacterium]